MNFDALSIAAMVTELEETVLGGRVQRVAQINSLTYGFEIFVHPTRHYLILSAEPQAPRLHLTQEKVRRGVGNDTPLMLVLRKYMRGARLRAIEQPPYERLIYFHFVGPLGTTILAMEMLGTRSNLLLLEAEQTILGVARLSKPDKPDSRQRALLPNEFYQPPRPQHKITPPELSRFNLTQELEEASPRFKLARLLPRVVSGVSPLLAREITYRATGQTDTPVEDLPEPERLLTAFEQLFGHLYNQQWVPTLAFDEDDEPVAFAPYPLQHLPRAEPGQTMSEVVEIYFSDAASGYTAAKTPLAAALKTAREKLARRRERLTEDAASQLNPERQKEKGEAILAYAHQIEPGQTEVTVPWPTESGSLTITLESTLSPPENAQQYFNRYRKAQRAADEIPAQFKKIELEEAYLEQLEQDLAMAEDRPEIDAIAQALNEAGYYRRKRRKKRQGSGRHYLRLTAPDGARVLVGKNAKQNAYLTFTKAASDDLWLHARDVPGAHLIIPTAEGLPSESDVLWAAGVAAYYSKARRDTSVEVAVTPKKYVRSIKGAAPGLVTYRNELTLLVSPHPPDND